MKAPQTEKIKAYQLPGWQMYQQALAGTTSWEDALSACLAYGLFVEAEYCRLMIGNMQSASNNASSRLCPTCGGTNGSHRRGCGSLLSKLRGGSR